MSVPRTALPEPRAQPNTADQHAVAAGQSADAANQSAQEAYNRVDSLSGVVANLDNYKPLSDVSVTFGFDKAVLTASDKKKLDELAANLTNARGYILEVTGGTDSTGDANYNYQLSQRRADAVVNYLASKYNIPPHKFYLIGIGKDQQVASNRTAAGRAKNRRVEIKLMSNMARSDRLRRPNGHQQQPNGQSVIDKSTFKQRAGMLRTHRSAPPPVGRRALSYPAASALSL